VVGLSKTHFALLEDEVWSERLEPTSLRHTEPTSFRCAGVSRSALSLLHLTAGASQPVQRPRVSCWSYAASVLVF
jgi:hypothetical protein